RRPGRGKTQLLLLVSCTSAVYGKLLPPFRWSLSSYHTAEQPNLQEKNKLPGGNRSFPRPAKTKKPGQSFLCPGMAERMRLERTMPCGTPHFQCGSLPIRIPLRILDGFNIISNPSRKINPFLRFFCEKKFSVKNR